MTTTVPHRAGCPCDFFEEHRCYPCVEHPEAILTHGEWAALQALRDNTVWAAEGLVVAIKAQIAWEVERRRLAPGPSGPPRLGGPFANPARTAEEVGMVAILAWLGLQPADLVVAVNHLGKCATDSTSACSPAYDDTVVRLVFGEREDRLCDRS